GTDEDLRAARQEEELRRIGSADAASAEASARERVAGLEAGLAAIGAERERTGAALAALPGELASLRERRTRVHEEATAAARSARERERTRISADLARAREKVGEAARAAESAAERAGAARNEVQRIDGDLALVRGQTAALREAVERADAELAAREDAHDLPPL